MKDRRADIKKWRDAVSDSDQRIIVKRVALALSAEFGIDGEVGISRPLLAERAGVSEDSVKSAVRALEAAGLLKVTPPTEDDGWNAPNFYAIQFPKAPSAAKDKTMSAPPAVEEAGLTTQGEQVSEDEDN